MRSKVYVARVNDYIPELLEKEIAEGLKSVGNIEELVSEKKVFIKINQLSNRPPADAVTTHPLLVEKVVKLLLGYGARIVIGDDIQNGKEDGFVISGMRDVARKFNVGLVNLRSFPYEKIEREESKFLKEIYIAKPVLEADIIVNLPKLKTHAQTILTAAIKNLYGIIPTGERSRLHAAFSKIEDFSEVIVDVFNARPPLLNIMDAVMAMEGEGPNSGTPRKLGILLISKDAVAMDSVVTHMLGLDLGKVKHIAIAASRGLGAGNLQDIDVVGADLQELKINDFKFPKVMWQAFIPKPIYRLVYKMISIKPKINNDACKLCGKCIERCPVKAMEIKKGRITIDYKLCIGCLCCQEICDQRAVKSIRPWIGEILLKSLHAVQKSIGDCPKFSD